MKKILPMLLVLSFSSSVFCQSKVEVGDQKEPVTDVVGDNQEKPAGDQDGTPPMNFVTCPFNLELDELIPSNVSTQLTSLYNQLKGAGGACGGIGNNIGDLLGLLRTPQSNKPPRDSGGQPEEGSGNPKPLMSKSKGNDEIGTGKPPGISGSGAGGQNCSQNPARCDVVISQILRDIQSQPECFTTASNGIDTILGAVLSISSSFGLPGVGQIALGVSTVKHLVDMLKGPSNRSRIDNALNKGKKKAKLDTLTACYANHLLQEAKCKEVYVGCSLGKTANINNGSCNFKLNKDIGSKVNINSRGSEYNSCNMYRDSDDLSETLPDGTGKKIPRKQVLLNCLKSKNPEANQNLLEKDFKIETHVMGDIYACTSYWVGEVRKKTGAAPSDGELSKIQNGCVKGKKTAGGADIHLPETYQFNEMIEDDKNISIKYVRDTLLDPTLREAANYHKKHAELTSTDRVDILGSVNQCFYGYSISLASRMEKKNDKTFYKEDEEFKGKCKVLNECFTTTLKTRPPVTKPLPGPEGDFSDFSPAMGLEELYVSEPPKTSIENICYGIAMNKFISHSGIATRLKGQNLSKKTCDNLPQSGNKKSGNDKQSLQ